MRPKNKLGWWLVATLLALVPLQRGVAQELPADTALEALADEAYIYGYPLLLMDVTTRVLTNVATPQGQHAPINQFARVDVLPDAHSRAVVMPNLDTLYTSAFLDLGREPIVLHVPDTHGRYYLMPLLDAYSNVFASPGKRTTGTRTLDVAIVGPGWKGQLPKSLTRIVAPTNLVWLIGRTQINGKRDLPAATALTARYTLTPLSKLGRAYTPPRNQNIDKSLDMETPPPKLVEAMSGRDYFARLAILLREYPPPARDRAALIRFEKLGLAPGSFAPSPQAMRAIEGAPTRATQRMEAHIPELGKGGHGWQMNTQLGSYGTRYLDRATVALWGFGANLASDALYPAAQTDGKGEMLDGANRYFIHFAADQAPPVNAFWSLTLYDADGYLVVNPIDRYAIGDRDALKYNPDGSLDILIQAERPQGALASNWLPAPKGPFQLLLRLYWPKESVLSGAWQPPPVRRIGEVAEMPRTTM